MAKPFNSFSPDTPRYFIFRRAPGRNLSTHSRLILPVVAAIIFGEPAAFNSFSPDTGVEEGQGAGCDGGLSTHSRLIQRERPSRVLRQQAALSTHSRLILDLPVAHLGRPPGFQLILA